jgi:arginase family enzyme
MERTFDPKNFTNQWWWSGIPTYLGCPAASSPAEADIGLAGVPFCGGNPITRMQYLAPREVRSASMAFHRAHRRFGINPFALPDPGFGRFADSWTASAGKGRARYPGVL